MRPKDVDVDAEAAVAAADAHAINFAWLVRLRWVAVVGQAATILGVSRLPGLRLPVVPLLMVVGVGAATNAVLALRSRHVRSVPEAAVGGVMLLDVALLTALLWLSGGPYNPFCFLYLLHVGLAAVILRPAWIWVVVFACAAAFGALFFLQPPPVMQGSDAAVHLRIHLRGMWVAFTVASAAMAFFVGRIRRALVERDRALALARDRNQRAERLASLGTLAAGAAHELSTPLASIAVAARELERHLDLAGGNAVADDARLIRQEVNRCRRILDRLVTDAGETAGEPFMLVEPGSIVQRALDVVPGAERIRVELPSAARAPKPVAVPFRALVQALRGLIDNAIEAAGPKGSVVVRVGADGKATWWEVCDDGPGMGPQVLARAGEPFFSTKPPGRGMGLGLFLARTLAERLGGELSIDSAPGRGTSVKLSISAPLRAGDTSIASGEAGAR